MFTCLQVTVYVHLILRTVCPNLDDPHYYYYYYLFFLNAHCSSENSSKSGKLFGFTAVRF